MDNTYTYTDVTLAQAILLVNYLAKHTDTTDITGINAIIKANGACYRNSTTVRSLSSETYHYLADAHEAIKGAYKYNNEEPLSLQIATWYNSKGEIESKEFNFYAYGA